MEIDDEDRFDLTGKVVVRGRAPEFMGSYSVVYRGKWEETTVAVKIIRSVSALSTMRRKVRRERMVWEALEHPNILPFYGHADDEEFQPFGAFISPWCANGDLGRFMDQYGSDLDTSERVELWKGVLSGVTFLHSRDPVIVHGDLKPGNILIDDSRNPRICDFGLSRIIQEGGTGGMTTTTEHTGTERYLAPELVTANLPVPTTESDVYALGCLGLELIYLERPYAHRQNNYHGCIITDIREGIPPATRQDDFNDPMDILLGGLHSWHLLEALWNPDPAVRPTAALVLRSLVTSNQGADTHIMKGIPIPRYDAHVEGGNLPTSYQEREKGAGRQLRRVESVPGLLASQIPLKYQDPAQHHASLSQKLQTTVLVASHDDRIPSAQRIPTVLPRPPSVTHSSSFQFTSREAHAAGRYPLNGTRATSEHLALGRHEQRVIGENKAWAADLMNNVTRLEQQHSSIEPSVSYQQPLLMNSQFQPLWGIQSRLPPYTPQQRQHTMDPPLWDIQNDRQTAEDGDSMLASGVEADSEDAADFPRGRMRKMGRHKPK